MEIYPPDSAAPVFGCHDPGSDIGVVVQAGDDDLIPGLPGTGDSAADGESQAGHVVAEDNPLRSGSIEEVRQSYMRFVQYSIWFAAGL